MSNVYMGTDVEEFIFGESTFEEACKKEEVEKEDAELMESIQAEMDATGVKECVDEPEVAGYRIALENEQNYNMVMNAFMAKEFSVLESTGQEMVYEAANVKQFFDSIQKVILNFWQKIQGAFKALNERITSYLATNKAFIKKYENADIKTPTEKTFKGWEFGVLSTASVYKAIDADLPALPNFETMTAEGADAWLNQHGTVEEYKIKVRKKLTGGQSEDFTKALKVKFYGSEKKKELTKLPAFKSLIDDLKNAKDIRKGVKDAYKDVKESVNRKLADVKKAKKQIEKDDKDSSAKMKVAKNLTDCISASLTLMSKSYSVQTSAYLAKLMQDRAMASYYVTHQPKVEKANESAIDDLGIELI